MYIWKSYTNSFNLLIIQEITIDDEIREMKDIIFHKKKKLLLHIASEKYYKKIFFPIYFTPK